MIMGSLSLAFCTVAMRRFVDRLTGRIPIIPVGSSLTNSNIGLVMFAGAMVYLYNHLKKGTLVKVGNGHQRGNLTLKSSIQKRPKNESWFMRNAWGKRKNCTDAIYRLAKHSVESLHNLNPCLLLPNKSFQISFPKSSTPSPGDRCASAAGDAASERIPCDVLYSNRGYVQNVRSHSRPAWDLKKSSLNLIEDNHAQKKRGRKGTLKRLTNKKVGDLPSGKSHNKLSVLEPKRITRSGRIYNPA